MNEPMEAVLVGKAIGQIPLLQIENHKFEPIFEISTIQQFSSI